MMFILLCCKNLEYYLFPCIMYLPKSEAKVLLVVVVEGMLTIKIKGEKKSLPGCSKSSAMLIQCPYIENESLYFLTWFFILFLSSGRVTGLQAKPFCYYCSNNLGIQGSSERQLRHLLLTCWMDSIFSFNSFGKEKVCR